jgi:hypothetical protein
MNVRSVAIAATTAAIATGIVGIGIRIFFDERSCRNANGARLTMGCIEGNAACCMKAAWDRDCWENDIASTATPRMPDFPKTVVDYYKRACLLGDGGGCSAACTTLAKTTPDDIATLEPLCKEGCNLGKPWACKELGRIRGIANKEAGDEAYSKAARLFAEACESEWDVYCLEAADAYREGRGVPRDSERANNFLAKFCQKRPSAPECTK